MNSPRQPFALSQNIDSLMMAAVGFAIIQVYSQHSGIGVSPDSVTYISAARNLYAGKGLTGFDNMPMVVFPALYSIFLATVTFIIRLDPVIFGAIVNGLLFGLLIYLCGAIMNGFYFFSKWYKRILLSCLVLSPCLLEVYAMLWSETLFILLLLFFMMAIFKYFQKHTMGSLVGLSVIVALACVTRYAGIALMCTGGLLLILDTHTKSGKKITHVIIYSVISSCLLFFNIARNIHASGVATGIRQKGTTALLQNIYYFGGILCDWLPVAKNNQTAFIVTAVFILICAVVFVLNFRNPVKRFSFESIAAAFCLVYTFFMLLSATVSRYEQFTNRLLSPLFIPLLWATTGWFPLFANKFAWFKKAGIVGLGLLLMAIFLNHQLAVDYETSDGILSAGIPGYTEDPFPEEDIVAYIKQNKESFKPKYAMYSNAGDAFYYFTGKPCQILPQVVFPNDVQKFYGEHHLYVIWFNDVDNPDLLNLQNILEHKQMTLVKQFDTGAIYVCE